MIVVAAGILLALLILRALPVLFWLLVVLCVMAALGIGQAAPPPPPEPYSCQLYREAAKKCAANTIGRCNLQHEVDRLFQLCLREGGKP
jgi:hypothetical protein